MTLRARTRVFVVGASLGSAFLLAPPAWSLDPVVDNDPTHHSTDVNDPDPAHHRPYVSCPASLNECIVTPIAGFDVYGYPLSSPRPLPAGAGDNDPAHHSTDLNDPDPAHHQPILVNGVLTPIPGFDLYGVRLPSSSAAAFS